MVSADFHSKKRYLLPPSSLIRYLLAVWSPPLWSTTPLVHETHGAGAPACRFPSALSMSIVIFPASRNVISSRNNKPFHARLPGTKCSGFATKSTDLHFPRTSGSFSNGKSRRQRQRTPIRLFFQGSLSLFSSPVEVAQRLPDCPLGTAGDYDVVSQPCQSPAAILARFDVLLDQIIAGIAG